jgi:Tfp pilus assembly protein PilX
MRSIPPVRTSNERGIALVMTLFLMAALSALAVSLMFLSQTETSSSRNYRTMSQARYAGEAGVHRTINHLLNSYTAPGTYGTYDLTKSPVTCTSGCGTSGTGSCVLSGATPTGPCVILSAMTGVASNYPDATVSSAFNAAVQGTLAVGTANVSYSAYAVLMSMRPVTVYGGGSGVAQTWQVVADGTVSGTMPATVEVTAALERTLVDANTFAIFATGTGCGAITMAGNEVTDSYNSTSMTMSGGQPVTTSSGGAVGTNGNLDLSGAVHVHGTLSTPRSGVGACANGNITAETLSGNASVDSGMISLPQAKTFPTPNAPSPTPPTTALSYNGSTVCAALQATLQLTVGNTGVTVTGSPGACTINTNGTTLLLGNITTTGGTLTFAGGTSMTANVNVNTFTMTGNSSIAIASGTSVTMNVAGAGVASGGTVLDFTGGSFTNSSFDPSKFQILYAGTNQIKMVGGSNAAATVYAPNAYVEMHGNSDFYGSILANTFNDTGGATVHYDTSLSSKFKTLSNWVMTSFSWKKY